MASRWLVPCLLVGGIRAEMSSCSQTVEADVLSPALLQKKSRVVPQGSATVGTSDAEVHGVTVRNYHEAFSAERSLNEEPDYSVSDDTPVDWIFTFREETTTENIRTWCSDLPVGCGAGCSSHGRPSSGGIPEAVVRGSSSCLRKILENHEGTTQVMAEVEADQMYHIDLWDLDQNVAGQGLPWGLDRSDQAELPLDGAFSSPGNQGRGIHVYVADTGIRTTHRDFGGRAVPTLDKIAGRVCSGNDVNCARDRHFHGSHCAGTVAGERYGVAKQAIVRAVKVLNDRGSGSLVGIVEALDWIAENHPEDERAVVSMSLGGSGQSPAFKRSIDTLLNRGIVTVVAAGNSNGDACRFSPAFVPNAITVGSTTSTDQRSHFSNMGRCVDIFAPGSAVLSCAINDDSASRVASGTSMACPHVAGAAAVYFSNFADLEAQDMMSFLDKKGRHDKLKMVGRNSPNLLLGVVGGTQQPPPTPTPPSPECRMVPAAVPQGHRCKGKPRNLTGGKRVSDSECKEACLGKDECLFAMYKTKKRKCAYFERCTEFKRKPGFVTWEKKCPSS